MGAIEKRSITCCFSGHRDISEEKVPRLKVEIEKAVRRLVASHGICYFGVGGAVGFDTLVAKVLFQLRNRNFLK